MSARRDTRITAICADGIVYGCAWRYNGPRSYIEADRHTAVSGHKTVVTETIRTEIRSPKAGETPEEKR